MPPEDHLAAPAFPVYSDWPRDPLIPTSLYHVYNWVNILNHLGKAIKACSAAHSDQDLGDAEFRPHDVTYLKLLLVASYAKTFLEVGSRFTDRLYYLDVLSASGISYARGREKSPIPSSTFIVPLAWQDFRQPTQPPKYGFSRVWNFDLNENGLEAIRQRRQALASAAGFALPEFQSCPGDANAAVQDVVKEIERETTDLHRLRQRRPLTLVFVDNLRLDINMNTIAAIQGSIRADLIVHLPTSAIWRCIRAWQGGIEQPKLTSFFGDESWQHAKDPKDVPALYHSAVRRVTQEKFQEFEPVRIKGPNSEFSLCFYVRETSGSSRAGKEGWIQKIRRLADACNEVDYNKIPGILDRVTRGQRSIFGFD